MRLILLLLLATACFADAPKYHYEDARLDDEMRNIYFRLSLRPQFIAVYPFTRAQIIVLTPQRVGEVYFCSDCTTDAICVSTGTTIGAFSRVSARTTACQ